MIICYDFIRYSTALNIFLKAFTEFWSQRLNKIAIWYVLSIVQSLLTLMSVMASSVVQVWLCTMELDSLGSFKSVLLEPVLKDPSTTRFVKSSMESTNVPINPTTLLWIFSTICLCIPKDISSKCHCTVIRKWNFCDISHAATYPAACRLQRSSSHMGCGLFGFHISIDSRHEMEVVVIFSFPLWYIFKWKGFLT